MTKVIIFSLIFCSICLTASPFADVPGDHWAYDALGRLADKGIISGYDGNLFKGSRVLSRYEFSLVLEKALACQSGEGSKSTDDDLIHLLQEFSQELELLGVKVGKLEQSLRDSSKEISSLRKELKSLSHVSNSNLDIKADVMIRFDDFDFDEQEIQQQYNSNFWRQRTGLNITGRVDRRISAALRVQQIAYWNTNSGDWKAGDRVGTVPPASKGFTTPMARIDIDMRKGKREISLGRQHFSFGHELLMRGLGDGLRISDSLEWQNATWSAGALKMTDTDTAGLNDNDGADLYFGELEFRLDKTDIGMRMISSGNHFPEIGTAATLRTLAADGMLYAFDGNAGRYNWFDISATWKPEKSTEIYGEMSLLKWENSINLENELEDGGTGFLIGCKWKAFRGLTLHARLTRFGDYFSRPSTPVFNNAGAFTKTDTLWDIDTFYNPNNEPLFEVAGFRHDFDDLWLEAGYSFAQKHKLTLRYEKISDNRMIPFGELADDRNILTMVYVLKYRPGVKFKLCARHTSCRETGLIPVNISGKGAFCFGNVSGRNVLNGLNVPVRVDDVDQFRVQMDYTF